MKRFNVWNYGMGDGIFDGNVGTNSESGTIDMVNEMV